MIKYRRNNRGGTNTVEFGPAVFVLIVLVMVPCIDMVQIGLAYGLGWYFEHMALREAACAGPARSATEVANIQAQWQSMGVGNFLHSTVSNIQILTNQLPDENGDNVGDYCWVQMDINVTPVWQVPFCPAGPVLFHFNATQPMEEQDLK